MEPSRQRFTKLLRVSEIFYFFLAALSFYLLFSSRTWEAHTVWEVMHPAFIPTMFVATSLLFRILLSSEKVAYKLLFIIVHSVLIHSIFSIVFPTGDLSGQQMFLGRTRLVYDNAVLHGWPPWPVTTVQSQIYEWFRGINFQAALSVAFARMFSIDFIWIHLFLVPVLWGVFTPIAAYLTTYTFTQNEKVAVLSSLLFSAFPWATYFGAISVPNSLGYIFFFYSLYFMLKNLDSNDPKTRFLTLTFPFFSLLSHHLTGIMSFCLLILALVFKSYKGEKSSSITAKVSLVTSFILCASLLPLSLIYLRFFRATTYTAFTLDKLYELPLEKIVGILLIDHTSRCHWTRACTSMHHIPPIQFEEKSHRQISDTHLFPFRGISDDISRLPNPQAFHETACLQRGKALGISRFYSRSVCGSRNLCSSFIVEDFSKSNFSADCGNCHSEGVV